MSGKFIFLLGGARSGKSYTAEKMATELGENDVLYVATAQIYDDEMRERIERHRADRPGVWRTLEAPLSAAQQIETAVNAHPPKVILLDCITLLTTNALFTLPDAENASQEDANQVMLAEINGLIALKERLSATWIVVSNEVGMGIVPPYRLGRIYRDALGRANQRLASAADEVYLMVAGLAWRLKG
jgi:adenosylcobinamide kinase/adenosylcobinamide-phosphate guanylyltransferase